MFGLEAISGIVHSISNVTIAGIIAHMASQNVFRFNAFTLTVIVIGICAIASIILRLVPKKKPVDVTAVPTVQVPMTNIPLDYQEYLKYRAYAGKYESEESLSATKFFSGFGKGKNWAKAVVMGTMIFILLVVGYSVAKELNTLFGKKQPPVTSTITNTGGGTVQAKTESKNEPKTSNGLNLNLFSGWF